MELARQFFGIGKMASAQAVRVIESILKKDPRFQQTTEGWQAVGGGTAWQPLDACVWYVLNSEVFQFDQEALRLLSIYEFHPQEKSPAHFTLYLIGSEMNTRKGAETLSERYGLKCSLASPLKALGLLDDLFRKSGVFLRGLQSSKLDWFIRAMEDTGTALPEFFFSLADALRLILPGGNRPSQEDVLSFFNITVRRETPFITELEALPAMLPMLLSELSMAGIVRVDEFFSRIESLYISLDLAPYEFSASGLAEIPEKPGVYLFKNRAGAIIYIGKSINLKQRVRGYFRWRVESDLKLCRIQDETRRFSIITMGSDLEALLEEARLISEHQPEINIQVEIHEMPKEKPLSDVLLVLLPHADDDKVNLFILQPQRIIHRISIHRNHPDLEKIASWLKIGCEDLDAGIPGARSYGPQVFPMAVRWLRKNSHRLTFFKYHDYANLQKVVQAISDALAAELFREKNIYI